MNMNQVVSALTDMFRELLRDGEERKIVFWLDKDKEFYDDIGQLSIDGVKIHILTDRNQFYTKYLLEEEDTSSSYLIYTNLELNVEDNWLADMVLYSKTFYADRISLILSELHIDPSLRSIIKQNEKFFKNKERFRKFKAFGIETYTEEIIELGIMSVLCNVKSPDLEAVLKTVLMDTLDDEENKYLLQMEKFFDLDVFWRYVENHYGYDREAKTLKTLLIHLMMTAFSHSVPEGILAGVQDMIAERNKTNSLVFIDHWMNHKIDYELFNQYAELVEEEVQLPNIIQEIPVDEFKQADIFPNIDRAIISYIAKGLLGNLEDYEEYTKLIKLRRAKHYFESFKSIYDALYYTIKMLEFQKEYTQGMPRGRAIDLYEAYVRDYHRMDTYYRKFYTAYDDESDCELLKKLRTLVENLYVNWYLGELGANWSQAVQSEMAESWSLPGVRSQQDFYTSIVAPHIHNGDRVFVIISDALRYEAAVELSERLNAETAGVCEMQNLLGVVPSITKLGMASLLPYREIDFDSSGRVLVDGQESSGLVNRRKIIEAAIPDSIAVTFQDVIMKTKASRRETFKGKTLIYIYHDTIDAIGDNSSTEIQTFDAVKSGLNQLYELVKILRNDLSATNIYITADHGFIYQREPLPVSEKLKREDWNTVEIKRRYMLTADKQETSGQLEIPLSSIVKNEQRLRAYVPNSTIRYRIQGGGANFVHGGASLQEIVVPLISFKNKRAGQKGSRTVQKVDIKLTNTTRKVTNSIFHLEFFQTEKVGGKIISRTVAVYMADEEGQVLSNEETIIGDRTFDHPADRTFKIRFALKTMPYNRDKTYYLMIKDTETGVVTDRIPFSINLGIVSDFDF